MFLKGSSRAGGGRREWKRGKPDEGTRAHVRNVRVRAPVLTRTTHAEARSGSVLCCRVYFGLRLLARWQPENNKQSYVFADTAPVSFYYGCTARWWKREGARQDMTMCSFIRFLLQQKNKEDDRSAV